MQSALQEVAALPIACNHAVARKQGCLERLRTGTAPIPPLQRSGIDPDYVIAEWPSYQAKGLGGIERKATEELASARGSTLEPTAGEHRKRVGIELENGVVVIGPELFGCTTEIQRWISSAVGEGDLAAFKPRGRIVDDRSRVALYRNDHACAAGNLCHAYDALVFLVVVVVEPRQSLELDPPFFEMQTNESVVRPRRAPKVGYIMPGQVAPHVRFAEKSALIPFDNHLCGAFLEPRKPMRRDLEALRVVMMKDRKPIVPAGVQRQVFCVAQRCAGNGLAIVAVDPKRSAVYPSERRNGQGLLRV